MITRLTDPGNISGDRFPELSDKISAALTRMSKSMPQGSPFHYAYLAPSPHEITDRIPTAATDGRKYYWNAEFLHKLTPDQVGVVLLHEAYHTVLFHTKRGNRDPLWNVAVDFVVNAFIMVDHSTDMKKMFPESFTLPELKCAMACGVEIVGICLDRDVHGRTAEHIYDELLQVKPPKPPGAGGKGQKSQSGSEPGDLPGKGGENEDSPGSEDEGPDKPPGATPRIKGGLDEHMDMEATPQEIADRVREAIANAEAMKSKLPGSIAGLLEGALIRLEKPKVDLKTLVYGLAKKIQSGKGGMNLDYKRPRRRSGYLDLGNGRVAMMPKRTKPPKLKYIVCMDTSGSMSDVDISATVSQLQSLDDLATGWIVPNDTMPYWEAMKEVSGSSDLDKIRVKGRGGTDYQEFFATYTKKCEEVDFIVTLTDGCFSMPDKPKSPVVWVVVNNPGFTAPYGRVVHLR